MTWARRRSTATRATYEMKVSSGLTLTCLISSGSNGAVRFAGRHLEGWESDAAANGFKLTGNSPCNGRPRSGSTYKENCLGSAATLERNQLLLSGLKLHGDTSYEQRDHSLSSMYDRDWWAGVGALIKYISRKGLTIGIFKNYYFDFNYGNFESVFNDDIFDDTHALKICISGNQLILSRYPLIFNQNRTAGVNLRFDFDWESVDFYWFVFGDFRRGLHWKK